MKTKIWKKLMAAVLAFSMTVPCCLPQTLWAADFTSESTDADVFTENFSDENTADEEYAGQDESEILPDEEISSGELDMTDGTEDIEITDTEDTDLDVDTELDMAGTDQSAEGYVMQLYSDGKLQKTYTIPYSEKETAKAPAALNKSGYTFKEWNTRADGTGTAYKPGASIKTLLEENTVNTQNQEDVDTVELSEETEEAAEETAQEEDAVSDQSDVEEVALAAEDEPGTEQDMQADDADTGLDFEVETEESADTVAASEENPIVLYAVWEKNATYKITYNLNGGKNDKANPQTYTSESKITLKNAVRSGYHFVGWYRDNKYKNKISTIEKGSKGNLTLYAKWTAQVNPSAKASTLNTIKGSKTGIITAQATVPKYVNSYDGYYYLVYVDSNTGKVKKAAAKLKKPEVANQKITFSLKTAGHPEFVQGKFAVAVRKTKSEWYVISGRSYVSNPENIAANKAAYYLPKTKKGIQSGTISEITETKSKTAFMNVFASDLMNGNEAFVYNGKKYYFNAMYGLQSYVQQCNAKGIQVTLQINLNKSSNTQSLIVGNSPYSDTAYYGWNTTKSSSRQTMEAMFAFLGKKFGDNGCYVSNWILGNEINSASRYYYAGNVSFSKYISMYSEAFRCLYNAVRSNRGSSKVFICLDNCWRQKNIFSVCYPAKSTMDTFASTVSKLQKGVNWNLAYHAYNQPLTEGRFWTGGSNAQLLSNDANKATFITMYNIQALTNYVKSKYGSKTRVILSEQGFSSASGGQANQAASMALAYYKAACNPMIDAFIIRSYKDESHEVAQGLALGLKDTKGKKKTVFNVFQNMDSTSSLKYTENILNSKVGKNWKSKVPGYNAKRVSTMYRAE